MGVDGARLRPRRAAALARARGSRGPRASAVATSRPGAPAASSASASARCSRRRSHGRRRTAPRGSARAGTRPARRRPRDQPALDQLGEPVVAGERADQLEVERSPATAATSAAARARVGELRRLTAVAHRVGRDSSRGSSSPRPRRVADVSARELLDEERDASVRSWIARASGGRGRAPRIPAAARRSPERQRARARARRAGRRGAGRGAGGAARGRAGGRRSGSRRPPASAGRRAAGERASSSSVASSDQCRSSSSSERGRSRASVRERAAQRLEQRSRCDGRRRVAELGQQQRELGAQRADAVERARVRAQVARSAATTGPYGAAALRPARPAGRARPGRRPAQRRAASCPRRPRRPAARASPRRDRRAPAPPRAARALTAGRRAPASGRDLDRVGAHDHRVGDRRDLVGGHADAVRVGADRLRAVGLVDAHGAEVAIVLADDVAADPADARAGLVALGGRALGGGLGSPRWPIRCDA